MLKMVRDRRELRRHQWHPELDCGSVRCVYCSNEHGKI